MNDSDYAMIFTTSIHSISNTLKNLWILSYFNSSYIQTIYNDKEESIHNTFIAYVEPLLDNINHPTLAEEQKLNLDAATYEKQLDAKVNKTLDKNKFIVMMTKSTVQ